MMRDALAILGGILAVVALTMAVVVFRRNFGGEDDVASLMQRTAAAEARAEQQDKAVGDLKERVAGLSRAIADLEEKMAADPRKLAVGVVNEEVNRKIHAAVQEEMNKRLQQAQLGASGGPAAVDERQKAFADMVASAKKASGADGMQGKRMEIAFERARAELNFIGSEKSAGKITEEEYKKAAPEIRASLDGAVKKILGEEKSKAYEEWKRNLKDDYPRRFLGL